jgi:hypothetical protein
MSPWDECICGHVRADHDADANDPGCATPDCPCPWFDRDPSCEHCGSWYGCECAAA